MKIVIKIIIWCCLCVSLSKQIGPKNEQPITLSENEMDNIDEYMKMKITTIHFSLNTKIKTTARFPYRSYLEIVNSKKHQAELIDHVTEHGAVYLTLDNEKCIKLDLQYSDERGKKVFINIVPKTNLSDCDYGKDIDLSKYLEFTFGKLVETIKKKYPVGEKEIKEKKGPDYSYKYSFYCADFSEYLEKNICH